MIRYYDRAGNLMSMEEWASALNGNCRVAETTLPDGKFVSTVWTGLDRGVFGVPLFFETMVFHPHGSAQDLDCERYGSEAEALEGHQRMVDKYTKGD